MRELRRGAGEFIAPQAAPGALPEMRCFGPNNCGCVKYEGRYPADARWACTTWLESLDTGCTVTPGDA